MNDLRPAPLVILGLGGPTDVATHLVNAARDLGIAASLIDYRRAHEGFWGAKQISWRLRGHRPLHLGGFGNDVARTIVSERPSIIITTGFAPLNAEALRKIAEAGVATASYLTDDPWNPSSHSAWFMNALPHYDYVFSTRTSNLRELESMGCQNVSYLPFGFSPEIHFPEAPPLGERFDADVVFVGGADKDRLPFLRALIGADVSVELYGGYWNRYKATRPYAKGHVDPQRARWAIGAGKVAPCLVRRSNRDGSSMRTFEVPAMGGCAIVEDTQEHRDLFGTEGAHVLYFGTPEQLVEKCKILIQDEAERHRLAESVRRFITDNGHSYTDRLKTMLATADIRIRAGGG